MHTRITRFQPFQRWNHTRS